MTKERLLAGGIAQTLAQALAAWAMIVHLYGWPDVSIWVVTFLLVAILVPFRHDGTLRDRAASNYGAGIMIAGFLGWDLIVGGLEGIVGGAGFAISAEAMMMLAATVLFVVAGTLFWLMRNEASSP